MTYTEMCKYVFEQEGFPDWEDWKLSKSREKDIRRARQICIYLGDLFFKQVSSGRLAAIFGQDHATALHSIKVIQNDCKTDKNLTLRISTYMSHIKEEIGLQEADRINLNIQYQYVMSEAADIINRMGVIAQAYCDITGKKMV